MSDILKRIEQEAGVSDLAAILADRLEPADLHSLLLEVYRRRAERRAPAEVFADYVSNRFVHPGKVDPRLLLEWDDVAFSSLPAGFIPIELSPLCPLGTSSVVAGVSQNKTVVTARNLEVVSDATNVLALECAVRRRDLLKANPRSVTDVHLAASHRLLRPQFTANPRLSPHFRLFSLCSAGRDTGDRRFESASLAEHIRFYLRALNTFLGETRSLQVLATDLASNPPRDRWKTDVLAPLTAEFPTVDFGFNQDRTAGIGYYREICFHINELSTDQPIQLADGGAVDWTQQLLSNAKERLFISGIGSERACSLRNP